MPQYKLYYFPVRAAAEPIRQIFAYAGVDYEDIRIPMEEWKDFKQKTPFGQMPFLEVDGKPLPQSFAIARYLASQHGLNGSDAFEAAWVDAIADQSKDYQNEFRNYWYVATGYREGDKDALRKEVGEPARDKFFPLIVKQLKSNSSGFLVGNKVTWVDFLIAEHVATVEAKTPGWFSAYPEVVAHSQKIRALPAIKKWIDTRPESN